MLVACSANPAGAVALAVTGHQCKLAHYQHFAVDILHVAVHHSLLVVEHAQGHYLACQPVLVLVGIGILYAQQH